MRIEEQNLESLRKMVRDLQEENKRLKSQLKNANIPYEEFQVNNERELTEYDLEQGGRIEKKFITEKMANLFFSMFWGRTDVYAKRGKKGGYFPQCVNRWDSICPKQTGKFNCANCEYKEWIPLTLDKIVNHLIGYKDDFTDVIGIYPLLPDGTCRFLVFDFDNHLKENNENDYANENDEWKEEVNALRKICEDNGISTLVERSRSGRGAHVWIFFKDPISAALARNFGFLLLDKGTMSVNLKTFQYYDRMYPSQDSASSIGNLVALPLQGKALLNGNSAFVDKNWNAYENQWEVLLNKTKKISKEEIEYYMQKWKFEIAESRGFVTTNNNAISDRPKPWKKKDSFVKEDVVERMHLVLSDGVYVDTLNLMPRIQNQLRSLAAFDNPIYYKNKRLGYSNWNNYSAIYLGKDEDDYIKLPRGLKDTIISECIKSQIEYQIDDRRELGKPIRVSFNGNLRLQQELAAEKILEYDNGILNAATAFGKTVVCSYLISERKVNTLILMQSVDLVEQWVDELHKFLVIDEELPVYKTKTGKEKVRKDVIGVLHGSKNTINGIIDVATIGSIYKKGNFNDLINSYGMVIIDECHHAASNMYEEVLKKINAKYVYGVSANETRADQLEKVVYMLIGPIRHKYTSKQRISEQKIDHYVYPRFTRIIEMGDSKNNINEAYSLICKSNIRNEMILSDIKNCIENNHTPIVLSKFKEHAKLIYDALKESYEGNVFLLYGDNTNKQNTEIKKKINEVPSDKPMILVATAQKVGEGFNVPRLDTLMLTTPLSAEQLVDQYLGRINRDYEGKDSALVYDYIDSHIQFFNNMYRKRLRAYKKIGFDVMSNPEEDKQRANYIYSQDDYISEFEQDIHEANKDIIICSPQLSQDKVIRFIEIVKLQQEKGVNVTVLTNNPDTTKYGNPEFINYLINKLTESGIFIEIKEELDEHFAVIDNEIVWYGGINLLGKADNWNNLIRIKSNEAAVELLNLSLM